MKAPHTLDELKKAIRGAIRGITLETCARVAQETMRRATTCAERKGCHFEHLKK